MGLEDMTLQARLLLAQQQLKAPKGQYNSFGKYAYRSAEDILEALKPVCAGVGITVTVSDDLVMNGDWHYIKATVTVTDGKETMTTTAFAREPQSKKGMDESQITGTASSYARKYALNGMFLIDDNKDADSNEHHAQQQNAPRQAQQNLEPTQADFKADYKKYAGQITQLTGASMEQVTEWVAERVGAPAKEFPQHQQAVIGAVLGILKEAQQYTAPKENNPQLAQERQAKRQQQQAGANPFQK